VTFEFGMTSLSALTLALAAGRSTTGPAGHSLHQPGRGNGSDRRSRPKPEDHQTATVANKGQNIDAM